MGVITVITPTRTCCRRSALLSLSPVVPGFLARRPGHGARARRPRAGRDPARRGQRRDQHRRPVRRRGIREASPRAAAPDRQAVQDRRRPRAASVDAGGGRPARERPAGDRAGGRLSRTRIARISRAWPSGRRARPGRPVASAPAGWAGPSTPRRRATGRPPCFVGDRICPAPCSRAGR